MESGEERIAHMARALGHPHRVAILGALANQSCVCGEIVDLLPLAQSTVSQHLKVLREAGWITGVVDGPRVCYSLNREAVAELRLLLDPMLETWSGAAPPSDGPCCS